MAGETVEAAESVYIQKVVEVMKDVSIPEITDALVTHASVNGDLVIATQWTQKNYELNKSSKFSIHYNYNKSDNCLKKISIPIETNTVLLETISPSLTQKAIIKKHTNETSKKEECVFELWSNSLSKRIKTINLTALDKHGIVHSDALFGSLCWSKDEMKVVYVAEKKKAKTCGFFEKVSDSESEKTMQGAKYDYVESWGEEETNVTNTVLCILSLADDTVQIVEGIPEAISPLHPQFSRDNTLIFVGFKSVPFRLGVIFCENRECGLYLLKLEEGECAVEVTNENTANYHPHVNQCEEKVVFIQRKLSACGDPHRSCSSLMIYSFLDNSVNVLCKEFTDANQTFPLFTFGRNSHNCWLPDDVHIVVQNMYKGRNYVCIFNTQTGNLTAMVECSSILSIYRNIVLTSYAKLNSKTWTLSLIDCNNPENATVSMEPLEIDDKVESGSIVDEHGLVSFYMMPKANVESKHKLPLFVTPHSGPHSAFTDNFSQNVRLFCKLGYAVLLVNYRGSVGFSEESLLSLPGHVGTQDVKDVQSIVCKFIELKNDLIDNANIFVSGGSHGGFLGTHLIGQFPDFYKAAALKNPVIDISAMLFSTDIPDWCYFESGLSYKQNEIPSSTSITSMLEKSPILHLHNIKAPVLLCIGDQDMRVPPSQGKAFFRLLKANKKVVKMLLYPTDCHPLSSVETDGDNTVNICRWFYQHGTHSR